MSGFGENPSSIYLSVVYYKDILVRMMPLCHSIISRRNFYLYIPKYIRLRMLKPFIKAIKSHSALLRHSRQFTFSETMHNASSKLQYRLNYNDFTSLT